MVFAVAVGILFGMGFGAGFGMRALTAQRRREPAPFRPMSSLREFDYREDPAWTR